MNEKTIITMKDIARELGVSIATVSRALKDSPRISTAQKERIQAFARAHNFCPNVIGEALRYSRTQPMKVIGVIIPEFAHYFFSLIYARAYQVCKTGKIAVVNQKEDQASIKVPFSCVEECS